MNDRFEILEWTTQKNQYDKINPVIYFSPTFDFLTYSRNNNNNIRLNVYAKNYDKHAIQATVSKASNIQQNLPSIIGIPNLYMAILKTDWIEKPKKNGFFSINTNNLSSMEIQKPPPPRPGKVYKKSDKKPKKKPKKKLERFFRPKTITEKFTDNIFELRDFYGPVVLIVVFTFAILYSTIQIVKEFDDNFEKRRTMYYMILFMTLFITSMSQTQFS